MISRQSRRQFLHGAGWVGVTLLAACNGGPAAAGPAAPASAPLPAAPSAAGGTGPTPTRAPVAMTVPYTPISSATAPFWIAVEEGLFAQEGLQIEPEFVGGTPPILQAMTSGEHPIGLVGGGDVILNRLGGGDAVLIGVYNAVLTIDCHARPNIRSVSELKGRTIAVTRLATSSYFAGVMTLASAGLKPEDVTWLQSGGVSESATVLMAGQADAAMIGYPSSLKVVQAGYPRLASPAQLGEYGLFPNNAIAVRDAWLREPANHDVALRFLRAVNGGLQVARTDDAALRRVLRKYTQLEDEGTLQATVDYTREYFPTTLRVDERGIRNALRLLDHPAAADADPRQFFDNSLVDQIAG